MLAVHKESDTTFIIYFFIIFCYLPKNLKYFQPIPAAQSSRITALQPHQAFKIFITIQLQLECPKRVITAMCNMEFLFHIQREFNDRADEQIAQIVYGMGGEVVISAASSEMLFQGNPITYKFQFIAQRVTIQPLIVSFRGRTKRKKRGEVNSHSRTFRAIFKKNLISSISISFKRSSNANLLRVERSSSVMACALTFNAFGGDSVCSTAF